MQIAFVHYHLRTSGVTRVIEAQAAALEAEGHSVLVLCGCPGEATIPNRDFPALDYTESADLDPTALASQLLQEATAAFGSAPDLWHFHNHSIGKNAALSGLPAVLAAEGHPVLLQLHDFAEDGRPACFRTLAACPVPYPTGHRVHYAFINTRDQRRLQAAGLDPARSHYLPNSVAAPAQNPDLPPSATPLVFYPARSIRRKNIGEACLLAALAPPGVRFAIALPPDDPDFTEEYQKWMALAEKLHLPIEFEVINRLSPAPGYPADYASWLAHSTHLLTTSVAEGFGLGFLEPVALKKPLLGRSLPEITEDFTRHGIDLGSLYETLPVPSALIDRDHLRQAHREALSRYLFTYRQTLPEEDLEKSWTDFGARPEFDFGNLPEPLQRDLVEKAAAEPAAFPFSRTLAESLLQSSPRSEPSSLHPFTPAARIRDLLRCYQTVIDHPPATPSTLPREKVLAQFLNPSNFHFLCS